MNGKYTLLIYLPGLRKSDRSFKTKDIKNAHSLKILSKCLILWEKKKHLINSQSSMGKLASL